MFGYTYDDVSSPDFPYFVFKRASDGASVGGMGTAAMLPEGAPSVWLSWFSVDSCDETAVQVTGLGGSVMMEPSDCPFGRLAVVAGAQGEAFGVIDLSRRPPETCRTAN